MIGSRNGHTQSSGIFEKDEPVSNRLNDKQRIKFWGL